MGTFSLTPHSQKMLWRRRVEHYRATGVWRKIVAHFSQSWEKRIALREAQSQCSIFQSMPWWQTAQHHGVPQRGWWNGSWNNSALLKLLSGDHKVWQLPGRCKQGTQSTPGFHRCPTLCENIWPKASSASCKHPSTGWRGRGHWPNSRKQKFWTTST